MITPVKKAGFMIILICSLKKSAEMFTALIHERLYLFTNFLTFVPSSVLKEII